VSLPQQQMLLLQLSSLVQYTVVVHAASLLLVNWSLKAE
jgi:hypothetical protein